MTRDVQCPSCRGRFKTSIPAKKFCTPTCQQRHKAVTRAARVVTQADFRPSFQEQHRRNSGADATRRAAQAARVVDWPAVIARFKASTAAMYESDDNMSGSEERRQKLVEELAKVDDMEQAAYRSMGLITGVTPTQMERDRLRKERL